MVLVRRGAAGKLTRMWRGLLRRRTRTARENARQDSGSLWRTDDLGDDFPVDPDIEKTLEGIEHFLEIPEDITLRRFKSKGFDCALLYIEGLIDPGLLQESVLVPLMTEINKAEKAGAQVPFDPEGLGQNVIVSHDVKTVDSIQDVVISALDGYSILIAGGWPKALVVNAKGMAKRSVQEPEAEVAVRGPRDGFTEDIITNLSLIRRRIRHPYLKVRMLTMGRLTRSRVAVVYVQGLARHDLLDEVMARLQRIDIDSVLESGVIEEFIEDSPYSPLPQMDVTERPDRVAAFLLEGKVSIFVDGTPFVITVPVTLTTFLRMPEDYYNRWFGVSLFRLIRYIGALFSLVLPSFYVALTSYHQELLPRSLALAIAMQREKVPYPSIVEALTMLLVFEVLTEATVRLPRTLGQTIGIVGAIVIGEAAVRANLISPVMVIVVSLTALAQFTLPYPITLSVRLLRIPILTLTSIAGLFGIFCGLILLLLHLSSLRSFGIPFLSPLAPFEHQEMADTIIRMPWWARRQRVSFIGDRNPFKMKVGLRPGKPDDPGQALELEKDAKPGRTD